MSTAIGIQKLADKAVYVGLALETARLCTVCWTVHDTEDCPECSARQWLYLAPLLRGFNDFGVSEALQSALINENVDYPPM